MKKQFLLPVLLKILHFVHIFIEKLQVKFDISLKINQFYFELNHLCKSNIVCFVKVILFTSAFGSVVISLIQHILLLIYMYIIILLYIKNISCKDFHKPNSSYSPIHYYYIIY